MNVLKQLSKDLKKKYEKVNPMLVKDASLRENLTVFSSGCATVDAVSGIGGFVPKGHVVEVIGANTSGKTTICLQTAREAMLMGENVLYIDAEGVLDIDYAIKLGVDVNSDAWTLLQPQDGDELIDILDTLAKMILDKKSALKKGETLLLSESVGLIVIDSVATVRPKEELEGNRRIGQHAALWAKLSYKIKNMAMMHRIGFALINQVRFAPDISGGRGPSGVLDGEQNSDMGGENTTGGEALKFLYSIRWQLKGFSKVEGVLVDPLTGEETEGRIGNRSHVKTIKNKLAPPLVQSQFVIEYGKGTVDHYVLTEIMKARGFIDNKGAYKKYEPLDPSLIPNKDHADYPGYLYGNARFAEWYLSPAVQADVMKRFQMVLRGQATAPVSSDSDTGDEHLEFEVEDGTPPVKDEIQDATEAEVQI